MLFSKWQPEITDFDFKTLASYEACVRQPRELMVDRMPEEHLVEGLPRKSG